MRQSIEAGYSLTSHQVITGLTYTVEQTAIHIYKVLLCHYTVIFVDLEEVSPCVFLKFMIHLRDPVNACMTLTRKRPSIMKPAQSFRRASSLSHKNVFLIDIHVFKMSCSLGRA